MNTIAPIFMLCGDYYDEGPAKKDWVEFEWLDETISEEEKLAFGRVSLIKKSMKLYYFSLRSRVTY